MLNRATLPGTTARTAGMRAPRPPDPMQQYVTAAMKDDERRAHNIASAQALAAVPVTGPEATLLGRLGQTITVPRAETDRLLNIREPAALPAAYVPAGPSTRELNLSAQSPQATNRCNQAACPLCGSRYTSNFTTEAHWASRDIRTSMGPTTGKLSLPVVGQCRRHFSDHIHHRLEALVQHVS
jgi:hypothetical protein